MFKITQKFQVGMLEKVLNFAALFFHPAPMGPTVLQSLFTTYTSTLARPVFK